MSKYWITTGTIYECVRAIRNMSRPAVVGDALHWQLVSGEDRMPGAVYSVAIERV